MQTTTDRAARIARLTAAANLKAILPEVAAALAQQPYLDRHTDEQLTDVLASWVGDWSAARVFTVFAWVEQP